MKTKIVGIFLCMLMIATAVPAVTSLKNNTINIAEPHIPLPRQAGSWTEIKKLLASDGVAGDHFGEIIAIQGDTAMIGSGSYYVQGSMYVFTRSGSTWTQQQKLFASDGAVGDLFGSSIALSGDTAFIGACGYNDFTGAAYVFTRNGSTWTQQQKLLASDGTPDDRFGSVSLSGDTALIGAFYDDDNGEMSGSAYVFTRIGSTWIQQQKLLASDGETGDYFGASVALQGDTALISANWDDDNGYGAGAAYVFTRTGTTWTQQQKLHASDGSEGDLFGGSVSLSGNTALIGAIFDDDNGEYSGSAYVFTRTDTNWTQQAKLLPLDGSADDLFGYMASLSGDTALIGAIGDDDNGNESGSVYVFTRTGSTWTQQQKLVASDGAAGDYFGFGSLDGDTAFIGAPYDDDNGVDSGSVYVFTRVQLPILDLVGIKGGLMGISVGLTNLGAGTAANIAWEMNTSGGLIYPRLRTGTIDILGPGQSETIHVHPVLGFGTAIMTFVCTYQIVNLSYDQDFYVKQEWNDRTFFIVDAFPDRIQPTKEWMEVENFTYFNRSGNPGVEFQYGGICNMHNVRVVVTNPSLSDQIEFLAACKFTNGHATLHECWLTKAMLTGGDTHWEVELVDGG